MLNNHNDGFKPIDAKEAMERMMKRIESGEPDRAMQRLEQRFRRGWHLGYSYAVDVICQLLDEGVPSQEVYRQIAQFENNVVMPWRHDISISGTPRFGQPDITTNDTEQE